MSTKCVFVVDGRLFTAEEVAEINAATIKDVILNVTGIPKDAIQEHPFFLNGAFNCTASVASIYCTV